MSSIASLNAEAMRSGYLSGAFTPSDVVEAVLAEAVGVQAEVSPFITIDAAGARAAAAALTPEMIRAGGPLAGIPVGIKDIIDVAGLPMTCHSAVLKDNVATSDAPVVQRLKAAGAVIVGKLSTHEFALGGPSFDLPFPPARNPWNRDYQPGGSSSGSGAAVGARLLPIALGTDTAGSIRSPAGACGVLGLKPTYGAVTRDGVFPLAHTLDHVGPLAHHASDLMATFDVIRDSGRSAVTQSLESRPLAGLKVGYVDHFHTIDLSGDAEVTAGLDALADTLERLGAEVHRVTLPPLELFSAVCRTIMFSEGWTVHSERLRETPELYGRATRRGMMAGAFIMAEDYVRAQRHRRTLSRTVDGVLGTVDILLCANMMDPPARIDDAEELRRVGPRQARVVFNVTGHPAVSLPSGISARGLPLSAQLAANRHREDDLFRALMALEVAGEIPLAPGLKAAA